MQWNLKQNFVKPNKKLEMAFNSELLKPWCCEYKPGYKSLIDKLIISFQEHLFNMNRVYGTW